MFATFSSLCEPQVTSPLRPTTSEGNFNVIRGTMAATAASDFEEERVTSIYRVARSIKRKQNSLYNALRSIYEDSIFVAEIAGLWPDLPLVANLRCGLWYSPRFEATCYFKSTDGHANNWSFSTSRLNLHLALLAGTSPTPFWLDFIELRCMEDRVFLEYGQKVASSELFFSVGRAERRMHYSRFYTQGEALPR